MQGFLFDIYLHLSIVCGADRPLVPEYNRWILEKGKFNQYVDGQLPHAVFIL